VRRGRGVLLWNGAGKIEWRRDTHECGGGALVRQVLPARPHAGERRERWEVRPLQKLERKEEFSNFTKSRGAAQDCQISRSNRSNPIRRRPHGGKRGNTPCPEQRTRRREARWWFPLTGRGERAGGDPDERINNKTEKAGGRIETSPKTNEKPSAKKYTKKTQRRSGRGSRGMTTWRRCLPWMSRREGGTGFQNKGALQTRAGKGGKNIVVVQKKDP